MGRSFASRVSHPKLKWVVLAFWVVLTALAAPLAGGLTDQQDNDIASWLPGEAESTRAIEQQAALGADPNTFPAVVVYERSDGLTDDDLAAVAADAEELGSLDALEGEVVGPIPAEDGEAAQLIVPINLGDDGWEAVAPVVDDIRTTAADGPDGLETWVTGPAGNAADSSAAFEGIDGTLHLPPELQSA